MKRIILLLFLFLLLSSLSKDNSYAQSSWFYQNNGANQPLKDVCFIDENTGWACASGGQTFVTWGNLIKTTNSGNNWFTILNNTIAYEALIFLNSNTGWMVGNYVDDVGGHARYIFRTTNGGINWSVQFLDSIIYGFRSVYFTDINSGWVVGSHGVILKTSNSGLNWVPQISNTTNYLIDVRFINSNTGWISGSGGIILKTMDGGINWNVQPSGISNDLYSTFFNDLYTGWASGSSGMVIKTTNSGFNWNIQLTNYPNNLNSVFFLGSNTGWISGGNYSTGSAAIFRSTDGGNNWTLQFSSSGFMFNSIYFINYNTGWAVGGYGHPLYIGIIYKTTNGGALHVRQIGKIIPKAFKLYQNYPNPFNPVTKIKFDVPSNVKRQTSDVKIVIYDVIGREIQTLLNEELKPGTYEIEWDAASYSSGVYYYRLVAGDFSETKKMVLMK